MTAPDWRARGYRHKAPRATRSRLRDDSRDATHHSDQARSTPTTTDASWGHFRPPRRGHCELPLHKVVHELPDDRLNDVMDMAGLAAGVRPQTDVGLLRLNQAVDDSRAPTQQRPQLPGFVPSQLRDPSHVPLGLDEECADSQRAHAMLYPPTPGVVDQTTRKIPTTRGEIARKTARHVVSHRDASLARPPTATRGWTSGYARPSIVR